MALTNTHVCTKVGSYMHLTKRLANYIHASLNDGNTF